MNRTRFLKSTVLGGAGLILNPFQSCAQQEYPDAVKLEIVKEFVSVAHSSLGKTKEMLENDHRLLHVAWDWGGGDYETALGAAGHMGNRSMAEYLIGKGARIDLFVASMMGYIDVVKPALDRYPDLIHAKGPHGFTMLHHAKVGKKNAKQVYEYLSSLGAKESRVDFYKK